MSIFYCSIQFIRRAGQMSFAALCAYLGGLAIRDKETGKLFNYRRKEGVLHCEVMLPDGADPSLRDPETFAAAVQKANPRADARLGKMMVFLGQRGLSVESNLQTARKFVADEFTSQGRAVFLAMHSNTARDCGENLRFHLLVTDQKVAGFGDDAGELAPGGFFIRKKDLGWNKKQWLLGFRERLAEAQNVELRAAGLPECSHRGRRP